MQAVSVFAVIVHSVLLTHIPIGFIIGLSEPYVNGFILLLTGHRLNGCCICFSLQVTLVHAFVQRTYLLIFSFPLT